MNRERGIKIDNDVQQKNISDIVSFGRLKMSSCVSIERGGAAALQYPVKTFDL